MVPANQPTPKQVTQYTPTQMAQYMTATLNQENPSPYLTGGGFNEDTTLVQNAQAYSAAHSSQQDKVDLTAAFESINKNNPDLSSAAIDAEALMGIGVEQ